jgi:hypothetical protein
MYNRYIGNTGRSYRVDDAGDMRSELGGDARVRSPQSFNAPVRPIEDRSGGILARLLPSLNLETGDIVLLLLFLFLYLESGDIEFLIILGFLALTQ